VWGALKASPNQSRVRALGAAFLVAILVALLLGSVWSPAEATPVVPAHATAVPAQVPNPANWLLQHLFANPFKSSVKKTISSALQSAEVAFQTPDVSQQPRIREIWQSLLIVSDSLLLLLLVVGAIMVVTGDWYLEAKELAPRAFAAALGVNLSLLLLGQGIGISNDLVKGFLQVDPNSLSVTTDRLVQSGAVAPIVLALLLVGALFLLLSNLIRVVMVVLLGISGPILQVFGVLPSTDNIARGWWRAAAACLVAPAVQALLLTIGVKVFFSEGGTALGAAAANNGGGSTLVDLILVLVIIALMAWIPLWMMKTAIGVTHKHIRSSVRVVASAAGVGA
jgi:Conjugal transfer protein TrbL